MNKEESLVYLSLGSNLENRAENIRKALSHIEMNVGEIIMVSPYYETPAWGFESEHNFLNLVVSINTPLEPLTILEKCKIIERKLGRNTVESKSESHVYKDRPIDIDIIDYKGKIINECGLNVPHLHLQDRLFVLIPLKKIYPQYIHPVLKLTINQLIKDCVDEIIPDIWEVK